MNRPFVRALLASAAIAAAVALSGCDPDSMVPSGRAQAPLSDKTRAEIAAKNMDENSPILVRVFKEEAEMEVWKKNRDGEFALLKTYPICRWSGDLGPKVREGDRQAPEGFYSITPGLMNPNSNYYLAFNTGYPNAFDRAWNRTGSELMVHGDCSSRGCYAMTDEQMQEIYALARDSFFGGQKDFQFEAFPFRMTALNMAKHRNNPNFAFWKMLKDGYDHFEATHQEPKVAVCEKHYVFDAAPPANASKPLSFNPRGKCPVYQLDPSIADAVLDRRRHEQFQMAEYISNNVPVTPSHAGIDGGMNPVFMAQISASAGSPSYELASGQNAPGALPHVPNRGSTRITVGSAPVAAPAAPVAPAATPADDATVQLASVPMPQVAPLPKEGEAPQESSSVASLFGNLFGGPAAQTPPAPAENDAIALRGTDAVAPAKSKQAAPVQTASAPAMPERRPPEAAAKPKAVASDSPAPAPRVQQARKEDKPTAPAVEMRTAYSSPPASSGGLLAGAQPVVPAGTFEARWTALR